MSLCSAHKPLLQRISIASLILDRVLQVLALSRNMSNLVAPVMWHKLYWKVSAAKLPFNTSLYIFQVMHDKLGAVGYKCKLAIHVYRL